ncbi:MAG: NAD(+) synthase [Bacilli bacterium]
MNLKDYLKNEVEKFLQERMQGFSGYILGLSGGIDSTLVAQITKSAVGREALLCLVLPLESEEADLEDIRRLIKDIDVKAIWIDLTSTYHHLLSILEKKALEGGKPLDDLARINLKVRLRMVTLYAFAQSYHSLVLGTDNASEMYTGYFTKYGDGAVDLLPIVHLTKSEVYQAAKYYDVPDYIIEKVPSAGLFKGQTDEGEMGISYRDLDAYLLGETVPKAIVDKIEKMHRTSEHKRVPIPRPRPLIRK